MDLTTPPATLGALIRTARKRCGLTQEDLGVRLGCTQMAVSAWEHDRNMPVLADMGRLVEVLNFTNDERLLAFKLAAGPGDAEAVA